MPPTPRPLHGLLGLMMPALLWLVVAPGPPATAGAAPSVPGDQRAGPGEVMRRSLDVFDAELDRLRLADLDIARAADRAAGHLLEGAELAVEGDRALRYELTHRPGAWQAMSLNSAEPGDVALVVTSGDADNPTGCPDRGPAELSLRLPGEAAELTLIADADSPLRTAAAWVFEVELFAAFTRRDRTMVVRACVDVDTRHDRLYRYGDQRFHDDRWLEAIPPTALGSAYLDALEAVVRDVATAEWRDLLAAARRARSVWVDGGEIWLQPGPSGGGRLLQHRLAQGRYPGFRPILHDPFDVATRNAALSDLPGPADLTLAAGYREWPGDEAWGSGPLFRRSGRGVVWIINSHNTAPGDLRSRERLVDLCGPLGDGTVRVPGYDASLGPVSGVTAELVLDLIHAGAVGSPHGAVKR